MKFVKVVGGEPKEWPITERQLRNHFNNVSLPKKLDRDFLETHGFYELEQSEKPKFDAVFQRVSEAAPVHQPGGTWKQSWSLEDIYSEAERQSIIAEADRGEMEARRSGVIEERFRRLSAGFDFDFGDERGVHRIGTRESDRIGWSEVDRWAAAQAGLGNAAAELLIVTDTGPVHVTPAEWFALVAHGASVQQPIWQASFALRAMDPVPEDYADDKWWP